jgi:uncharacterized membrane protein
MSTVRSPLPPLPDTHASSRPASRGSAGLRLPGLLLGIGLGGFVDGIVLHQVLQWHHMLTSEGDHPATTVAGLEVNTLWDGVFHAASWVAVAVGLLVLWRRVQGAGPRDASGRVLLGWMLAGWGLFNLAEGLIDHHLLTLHHVREGVEHRWAYDVGFLVLGALLVAAGLALAPAGGRGGRHERHAAG